jgi:ferric-dicitrate binding protein FerR (iron transport regulator)
MRKLIMTAAAAAVLASGTAAFAAVKHTTGTIKTYDGTALSLVLDDGSTFTLAKTFKDPGLKAGDKVRVSWDKSGNDKIAETVKIVK